LCAFGLQDFPAAGVRDLPETGFRDVPSPIRLKSDEDRSASLIDRIRPAGEEKCDRQEFLSRIGPGAEKRGALRQELRSPAEQLRSCA